ncbi:3-oxoacyl-[acyl-carrier-protein] reductase 4 [Madurella fahalii]|uniref:3-oxoacyl-[acyl-carrier-protein] reductase 4 n=1 Tax=Madurella fahalii TaxID=1157608 RepID=A0ABQ0GLG9_9PEZI
MASYWDEFVASRGPEAIAKQLLQDAARLDEGGMPSQLAMHIPIPAASTAMNIASYLTPSPDLHPDLKRFLYEKIRTRLRKGLEEGELSQEPQLPADGYLMAADFSSTVPLTLATRSGHMMPPGASEPTKEEVEHALKVLRYANLKLDASSNDVLERAIAIIKTRFTNEGDAQGEEESELSIRWNDEVNKYHAQRPPTRLRVCYICRFLLIEAHPRYRSMCRPCGAFNYAGSALSLPSSLKLFGRTAIVTGARVNLGYHTALRLLRCGAMVMATTRYPNDAAVRYSREPDFEDWQGRLKVIGADFRTARDAFTLVRAVRSALGEWSTSTLDILINNAAQTLTDSVKKEEQAIVREQQHSQEAASTNLLFHTPYQPRIRGGVAPLALFGGEGESSPKPITTTPSSPQPNNTITLPTNVKDDGRATSTSEPYFPSSWVQTLAEIPYEDIVSAHAVNAFVPLILCRELLPLMGRSASSATTTTAAAAAAGDAGPDPDRKNTQTNPPRPLGYIINVSSREGLFESTPQHAAKRGTHVHTNMTKAAVNMITQTEAAGAWRARRVAMNTVDPGFMSAAPEMDLLHGGERPLDWEDGAGRVLWPVAIGEGEGEVVWGRFLKHYGAVPVEVGRVV